MFILTHHTPHTTHLHTLAAPTNVAEEPFDPLSRHIAAHAATDPLSQASDPLSRAAAHRTNSSIPGSSGTPKGMRMCLYTCKHTYMHVCVCTFLELCHTFIHIYIHTYIYTYKHTYIHTYIHTHVQTHVHTSTIHMHIQTHIHPCIHTYIKYAYIPIFIHTHIHLGVGAMYHDEDGPVYTYPYIYKQYP